MILNNNFLFIKKHLLILDQIKPPVKMLNLDWYPVGDT